MLVQLRGIPVWAGLQVLISALQFLRTAKEPFSLAFARTVRSLLDLSVLCALSVCEAAPCNQGSWCCNSARMRQSFAQLQRWCRSESWPVFAQVGLATKRRTTRAQPTEAIVSVISSRNAPLEGPGQGRVGHRSFYVFLVSRGLG